MYKAIVTIYQEKKNIKNMVLSWHSLIDCRNNVAFHNLSVIISPFDQKICNYIKVIILWDVMHFPSLFSV